MRFSSILQQLFSIRSANQSRHDQYFIHISTCEERIQIMGSHSGNNTYVIYIYGHYRYQKLTQLENSPTTDGIPHPHPGHGYVCDISVIALDYAKLLHLKARRSILLLCIEVAALNF